MTGIYGTVSIDGNMSDWTQFDRITSATSSSGSYDIFGKYDGTAYLFAIKSSSAASIGANTTLLLNTDQNLATGGNYGADYLVNVFTDSIPYLYKGDGSYIKPLDYAYDSSHQFVEFAVLGADIQDALIAPGGINFVGDVNDAAFFPNDYASGFQFTLSSIATPPPQMTFGSVTLDGSLNDWAISDRLDYLPGTNVFGYESYGKFTGDAYTFALKAPTSVAIGANTTFWLDTDRNTDTGYQIFGTPGLGGAEYQINIDPDGKAYLYKATGPNTLTRTSNTPLAFALNSTSNILEVAVPIALLNNNPQAINMYGDINNTVYFPGDYNASNYTVFANRTLPTRTDTSKKIAIVYSQTTADLYFGLDKATNNTAYSQLFMSVQNQAMQAGVPFDLLMETDLKDLGKLINYDAIVFPSFRFVNKADVQAIADNLRDLVYRYGTGLITSGDFMTTDEHNAILAGDPYARMKTLLNINPTAFGTNPTSVTVNAGDITHPVMQGYAANEVIRSYPNLSWASYDATYTLPTAKTILETQTINGIQYNATLATQTGLSQTVGGTTTARNVHFATASYMADNNLLWKALDWSIFNGQPSVSLHLTRNNNLFLTRVDMDEAMAAEEVDPGNGSPGIYDKLLPILQEWAKTYNFVGSYYIDVGNQDPTQTSSQYYTDWAVSAAYYQQLLAAGNEIGSHSHTHLLDAAGYGTPYEDTNAVLGKTTVINGQTWDILQYEFEHSKAVIEQNLGITVTGAAIPGAPEKLPTSLAVSQYYDYITGGYTGVGAGYPSAFGFLLPGQDQVYFAPNLSFDFTLLEFGIPVWNGTTYEPQKLTAAQAAQEWVREYSTITQKADNAIVLMPWHDYGPTNFFNAGYTVDMFSTLLAKAYADGTEFTTLDDANKRIRSFEQSKLFISSAGNTITATVAPAGDAFNTGKFGLEVDGNQTIHSVNNWYAYNDKTVFLPKDGGSFTINLNQTGQTAADVTHITSLPMRAELLSLTGDGSNLNFSFTGSGTVVIDLKNPAGQALTVTGANSSKLTGDILELTFNQSGTHTVGITLKPNPIANLTVNQGTAGSVVDLSTLFAGVTAPITTSIVDVSNPNLVTVSTLGSTLLMGYDPGRFGTSTITIKGTANDTLVQATLTLTVNPFTGQVITGTSASNDLKVITTTTTTSSLVNSPTNLVLGLGGDDKLSGNDKLVAGGTDFLFGGSGNDTLEARKAETAYLNGGAGNDTLKGGEGKATLVGGIGNDTLQAGSGGTTLIGVNPFSTRAGVGEMDSLIGSDKGTDIFVLGDQYQVYYNSGSATSGGLTDYALIDKLKTGDRIQLKGTSADYVVRKAPAGLPGGLAIYLRGTNGQADELIAIVKGVSSLDLNGSSFIYV